MDLTKRFPLPFKKNMMVKSVHAKKSGLGAPNLEHPTGFGPRPVSHPKIFISATLPKN